MEMKNTIIISAEIENQLNSLNDKEKINYMDMLGIKEAGIKTLTKKGYNLLNLETFLLLDQKSQGLGQ